MISNPMSRKVREFLASSWKLLVGLTAIVSCIAAVIVVPEIRVLVGLDEREGGANSFRIEAVGISASPYSGATFPDLGDSQATMYTVIGNDGNTQYWLDYEISATGQPGMAVLEFKFNNVQNLVAYKYIKFTIDFVTPDTQAGFYFENQNEDGEGDDIILSKNTDIENVMMTHLENERYRFQIPLDRFTNTNMSSVSEFGIYLHSDFIVGKGEIMIENISFEME